MHISTRASAPSHKCTPCSQNIRGASSSSFPVNVITLRLLTSSVPLHRGRLHSSACPNYLRLASRLRCPTRLRRLLAITNPTHIPVDVHAHATLPARPRLPLATKTVANPTNTIVHSSPPHAPATPFPDRLPRIPSLFLLSALRWSPPPRSYVVLALPAAAVFALASGLLALSPTPAPRRAAPLALRSRLLPIAAPPSLVLALCS